MYWMKFHGDNYEKGLKRWEIRASDQTSPLKMHRVGPSMRVSSRTAASSPGFYAPTSDNARPRAEHDS